MTDKLVSSLAVIDPSSITDSSKLLLTTNSSDEIMTTYARSYEHYAARAISSTNLAGLGIGTTWDATNRFTVKADGALFTSSLDSFRFTVNKSGSGNTASFVFQTGFVGHAEIGLTGDDNFHFKVSSDGSAFKDALVLDKQTGVCSMTFSPHRVQLTSARTYYVRKDGSDSNVGTADTAGGAFLTVQKGLATAFNIDLNGFDCVVCVKSGDYRAAINSIAVAKVGVGIISIIGGEATKTNVMLGRCSAYDGASYVVGNVAVGDANGAILAGTTGILEFGNVVLIGPGQQIRAENGGYIRVNSDFSVSCGGGSALWTNVVGLSRMQNRLVTFTTTCTYQFTVNMGFCSTLIFNGNSFHTTAGTVLGQRYYVDQNSLLYTGGGGANYIPGDVAGVSSQGGLYQ